MAAAVAGGVVDPVAFERAVAQSAAQPSFESVVVPGVVALTAQALHGDEVGLGNQCGVSRLFGDHPVFGSVPAGHFLVSKPRVVWVDQDPFGALPVPDMRPV